MAARPTERKKVVFLADRDGTWRSALAERLRSDEVALIETADGGALRRALTVHSEAPDVAIVGHELELVDGLEALFHASQHPERPALKAVFLVTEVHSDQELLDLWRRRGVTGFLRRGDLVARSASLVRCHLFADARAEARHAVTLPARLELNGVQLDGMVEDLSRSGAMVSVVAPPELAPEVGHRLGLSFRVGHLAICCGGEVRRVISSQELFGTRLAFGLRLLVEDAATRAVLDQAVEEVSRESSSASQLYGALGAP